MKAGFGFEAALFNSTNRNSLQVGFSAVSYDRFITSIHVAYTLTASGNAAFEAGRLMIVKGLFDVGRTQIDPWTVAVPSNFTNSIVYDLGIRVADKEYDFGPQGFQLVKDQDYTVILVRPAVVGSVWPLGAEMNGFLNVMGFAAGGSDPFGGQLR